MARLLIGLLPVLGCGAVMFICMRMMSASRGGARSSAAADRELLELREEVARLRAQIAIKDSGSVEMRGK